MSRGATTPEPTSLTRSEPGHCAQLESIKGFPQVRSLEERSWAAGEPFSNGITIRRYQDQFQHAWDEYVYRHPSGSLFHLTAWKRVIEKTFRFESRYLLMEERGTIRGVLPLFVVPNFLLGRSLISTPLAVYGGVCADDEQMSSRLRKAACQMAEREGVQYLELREQWPLAEPGFQTKELYVTFDQELPSNVDQLLRGFPRDTRYMIRKGQKNGLRAVVDPQQLDIFYEIYSRSFHQLGTPVFSKCLFRVVLEELGEQSELTTVWHGEKALAAVLTFRYRDWVLPYFGGSLVEGRRFAANNFMYYEVMRRALEGGARHFDFGRSKLGSGSYAFKTQWNMRERRLPYQFFLVRRKSMPNFSPANPKFRLAISLWKSLPFPLTKILGPVMVRAFP
jgi:FemAB-related protein (PEP-CTERM system-associated)